MNRYLSSFSVLLCSGAITLIAAPIDEINRVAEAMQSRLIEQRRDFHMHPELSNREVRTSAIVAERLRALGFDEVRTNVARHGVVGLLKGGKPGGVVAVRADMDALPLQEETIQPYKSLVPNVMHACGHDVHTTVALGTAELLSKIRDRIPGSVKFIFQPAEEGAPPGETGGASQMIKEGALENPKPSAIFALHTSTDVAPGKVGFRSGGAQASADSINLVIHGKPAHAADPEEGIDAIVVAADCVSAIQKIRSRRISTFEPMIITFGTIHGGARRNIIPDEVKLEGTLRTLDTEVRKKAQELIDQTVKGVCAAYGATYELKIHEGTGVVYNDPKLVKETVSTFKNLLGETNVVEADLRMGAEDFSCFQEVIPGFLFRLGSRRELNGKVLQAHSFDFDVDEKCLVVGVKAMATALIDYLERQQTK